MHLYYYIGAVIFSLLLVYQQILVKPSDLSKVNIAFMTTNGVASIVFAACAIADMVIFG
jgi:4-hydroxybenzoate polyprenyltransferase